MLLVAQHVEDLVALITELVALCLEGGVRRGDVRGAIRVELDSLVLKIVDEVGVLLTLGVSLGPDRIQVGLAVVVDGGAIVLHSGRAVGDRNHAVETGVDLGIAESRQGAEDVLDRPQEAVDRNVVSSRQVPKRVGDELVLIVACRCGGRRRASTECERCVAAPHVFSDGSQRVAHARLLQDVAELISDEDLDGERELLAAVAVEERKERTLDVGKRLLCLGGEGVGDAGKSGVHGFLLGYVAARKVAVRVAGDHNGFFQTTKLAAPVCTLAA